ncbi:hypothetical protein GCM10009839_73960 [Catenulispora yoronensis]|uniref:Uncharacterized protein n=1 Tax=Catenulispora yoronensis TaxID=450799 RepID=A0ABN2V886_9ACTN
MPSGWAARQASEKAVVTAREALAPSGKREASMCSSVAMAGLLLLDWLLFVRDHMMDDYRKVYKRHTHVLPGTSMCLSRSAGQVGDIGDIGNIGKERR